ncbi:hypothetical protein [Clostridium beijerinckii]|uniref:Uncharacterized protein n=1 Tax=Clostridium beijerinckii TaxID=1520 RepID=A0A7X9XRN3_CLOBE|nr:hypothetical protein [Clostridium beijerinckii]NMF07787.1 hypothetical protein [Clostridium beijerinckii]
MIGVEVLYIIQKLVIVRKQGMGTKLVNTAIQALNEQGINEVAFETNK